MASKTKSILFLTYGGWKHASSRIRALNYINKIKSLNDYRITWLPRAHESGTLFRQQIQFFILKRCLYLKRLFYILFYSWDLIFIQRDFLTPFLLRIIKWKRTPFIYDFDDAIYLGGKRKYDQTVRLITDARKTIVSSSILSEFCVRHGVYPDIIPSPVDEKIMKPVNMSWENKEIISVGWIGSPWTEHYILNIQDSLREIANQEKISIVLIGASKMFEIKNLSLQKHEWALEREDDLLQKIDIGIMPLLDDEWSKGKGGYKLYQYMAAGIPVVASPVGINQEIVAHQTTGFLASTHEEWVKYLMLLIKDHSLRRKMGGAGRMKFKKEYSYKVCVPILNVIFKEILVQEQRSNQRASKK